MEEPVTNMTNSEGGDGNGNNTNVNGPDPRDRRPSILNINLTNGDQKSTIIKTPTTTHQNSGSPSKDKSGRPVIGATPSEKVKVIVRCRPLSSKEIEQGHTSIAQVNLETNEIEVHRPNPSSTNLVHAKSNKVFTFDSIYDHRITQQGLYEAAFAPLVDSVLEGFNGTIFAYGQTGTGKTYTMEGIRSMEEHHGVIPNAFKQIFHRISSSPNKEYLVRASYLEIYQEEIRDLLFKDRIRHCELKESSDSGVYVKGLSSYLCGNFDQINELMTRGNKNRSVGATNMNEHSSRSHAIFMITVEVSERWADGRNHFKVGKLNLVDLAGSERQGKSGAEGERLKEAVKINMSLSALGNVIAALVDGKSTHVPYRDSKLTRLLQDSLGGNSRTIMVATVGPASFNYDETMTTLRYASRAKRIKNKPKVNEDPKDAMLREYQEEIAKLRAQLEARRTQGSGSSGLPPRPESRRSAASRPLTSMGSSSLTAQDRALMSLIPALEPYGVDPSMSIDEVRLLLEKKHQELLESTQYEKEEKARLLSKLEETQGRVLMVKNECAQLHERISWLESKVLNGDKTLLDHTNHQQALIQARQKELDEQLERESLIRTKIAEHELNLNELNELVSSLESEVELKEKKVLRLKLKNDKLKEQGQLKEAEHLLQREEWDLTQIQLQKQIRLKQLVMENFIPAKTSSNLESLLRYNPEEEQFQLLPLTMVPISRPPVNRMIPLPLIHSKASLESGTLRPMENLYYTDENIIQLEPEFPKSCCQNYVPPDVDPQVSSLLRRAFSDIEKEVVIDLKGVNAGGSARRNRLKTARRRLGEVISLGPLMIQQVLPTAATSFDSRKAETQDFQDYILIGHQQPRSGTRPKTAKALSRAPSALSSSVKYSTFDVSDAYGAPRVQTQQQQEAPYHHSFLVPPAEPFSLDHDPTYTDFDPDCFYSTGMTYYPRLGSMINQGNCMMDLGSASMIASELGPRLLSYECSRASQSHTNKAGSGRKSQVPFSAKIPVVPKFLPPIVNPQVQRLDLPMMTHPDLQYSRPYTAFEFPVGYGSSNEFQVELPPAAEDYYNDLMCPFDDSETQRVKDELTKDIDFLHSVFKRTVSRGQAPPPPGIKPFRVSTAPTCGSSRRRKSGSSNNNYYSNPVGVPNATTTPNWGVPQGHTGSQRSKGQIPLSTNKRSSTLNLCLSPRSGQPKYC